MKQLLHKERRLSLHITSILFLSFGLMVFIPAYPYYVILFYTGLSVFMMFMQGREDNDLFFTALLPVAKRDVVKARFATVVLLQLAQLVLIVPCGIVRNLLMEPNAVGNEVNVAFFGFALVIYAAFNGIVMPGFYNTGRSLGVPFLVASVVQFLLIFVFEALCYIPFTKGYIDTVALSGQPAQLPVLLGGIAVYLGVTIASYRVSAKRFEELDL